MAAVALTQACGGSSDGTAPGTPSEAGTGDETGSAGQDATPPEDASADGETITDGGSNIDPDAGDDDAGVDGGPCNAVANTATAITSVCVSVAPALGGGTLVAGTYFLTHVAALAPQNFCQMKFVPTGLKETADLTVSAAGVGTVETVTTIAGGGTRHRTATLTPAPTDKSPLAAAPVCPTGTTTSVQYASNLVNAKQELVMRLPYGKSGEALYRYTKQ
jgi:hypothetical protein